MPPLPPVSLKGYHITFVGHFLLFRLVGGYHFLQKVNAPLSPVEVVELRFPRRWHTASFWWSRELGNKFGFRNGGGGGWHCGGGREHRFDGFVSACSLFEGGDLGSLVLWNSARMLACTIENVQSRIYVFMFSDTSKLISWPRCLESSMHCRHRCIMRLAASRGCSLKPGKTVTAVALIATSQFLVNDAWRA